ncbi:MAG: pentapeptide repeat-containing protein [Xenococcaceae cyanobacterium MO_188.B29]|nr:pentapeptide repeat-containing protein [Xenococcaceae cyanobacterium MO_188.B29]
MPSDICGDHAVPASLIAFLFSIVKSEEPNIFSESTNLNAIYDHLLKSVYERGWDTERHLTLREINENEFVRILEEIALSAWHGNGRTTTVKEIEAHCENSDKYCKNSDQTGKSKKLLERFKEQAKNGATKHLTIFHGFYFGKSERKNTENETFEFTHKSFAEYLTARRIVRELKDIDEELGRRKENIDKDWDENQALTRWAMVCGMSAIDEYLFEFICNEIALQDKQEVKQWQKTLSHLIGFMLRHGMPMERIAPRPSYKEECRQSRNAEEALLAVLNACARYTKEISAIEWQSEYSFGKWLSRLQDHIEDNQKIMVNQCLSWLNLGGANLGRANLGGANLGRANLGRANLGRANLGGANLGWANLEGANLGWANLEGANLGGAKMDEDLRRELESKLGIKINRS